jgi:hypothetical protein
MGPIFGLLRESRKARITPRSAAGGAE